MRVQEPRHTRLGNSPPVVGCAGAGRLALLAGQHAFGVRHYGDPETGNFAWFAFWMAAVLVSILIHELGHVLVGRLLGCADRSSSMAWAG